MERFDSTGRQYPRHAKLNDVLCRLNEQQRHSNTYQELFLFACYVHCDTHNTRWPSPSIHDIVPLMGRKPSPKPDDAAQSKRFVELAEEVGADTDDAALERALTKIVRQKNEKRQD